MVSPYTVTPNRNRRSILLTPEMKPYTVRPRRVDGPEWDAQQFYFRSTTVADVSPAFDEDWTFTTGALRRALRTTALATDSITNFLLGAADGWTTDQVALIAQHVSARLRGGVVLNGASLSCVLRAFEGNVADNLFTRIGARICSADGGTIRATLLPVDDYRGTEVDNTLVSRIFANAEVVDSYTTQEGDRLVIETGMANQSGDGSPNARITFGSASISSQPDYELVEGDSSTRNGWVRLIPGA